MYGRPSEFDGFNYWSQNCQIQDEYVIIENLICHIILGSITGWHFPDSNHVSLRLLGKKKFKYIDQVHVDNWKLFSNLDSSSDDVHHHIYVERKKISEHIKHEQ